jgi:diadenylate cyclase
MRLDKFIARSRIVDLKSHDLKGALEELLAVSVARFKDLDRGALLEALLNRENTMTTYLGNGVALPHIRIKMPRRYIFAVGRSENGIIYDGFKEHEKVRLVLMLIAGEGERDYLQMLASIARLVKDKDFVDEVVAAPTLDVLYDRLMLGVGGVVAKPIQVQKSRMNRLIFRQAEKIAKGTNCSTMVIFGDTLTTGMEASQWFPEHRSILVTRTASELVVDQKKVVATIQVRSFSRQRLSQLRSSVLVGLTRGLIRFTDRLCCVGGIPGSNQFDTIVVLDVEKEFQVLFHEQADILPGDVKPEVLERVLAIATELAVEGREGRPVGSLFVLGDTEKVSAMTKPLVLNPFFGYKEEDRNLMNPFMDETIKEFSCMDGAFVIRGDGVVIAAGSLIHAPDYYHSLPSGLGARHAAAASISLATDCISIVISSSTGQVTLFRRGVRLPLIEKPSSGGY